jgi:hypothetical protein
MRLSEKSIVARLIGALAFALGATASAAAASALPEHVMSVDDMRAANCSINYTAYEGGSHMYTWKYAYSIEGVREWLFAQKK